MNPKEARETLIERLEHILNKLKNEGWDLNFIHLLFKFKDDDNLELISKIKGTVNEVIFYGASLEQSVQDVKKTIAEKILSEKGKELEEEIGKMKENLENNICIH